MLRISSQMLAQHGILDRHSLIHKVSTRLVKRNRVEGSQHADIGHYGSIVFSMAVAEGGYIHDQADVETGSAVAHSQRVFRHLLVQVLHAGIIDSIDCIHGTHAQATPAADAFIGIDSSLAISDTRCAMSADFYAAAAANAFFCLHLWLAIIVHLHLARTGTAAHAKVFQRAAEARHLMSLEMGQANNDIGIHQRTANLRFLHQLAVRYGYIRLISTLQTVSDDYMAASGERIEAILIGSIHMLQRVLTAADIKSIAVRQEGLSAQLLYYVHNCFGIVRTQVGDIAKLAKMDFDGNELFFKVNIADASFLNQHLQTAAGFFRRNPYGNL